MRLLNIVLFFIIFIENNFSSDLTTKLKNNFNENKKILVPVLVLGGCLITLYVINRSINKNQNDSIKVSELKQNYERVEKDELKAKLKDDLKYKLREAGYKNEDEFEKANESFYQYIFISLQRLFRLKNH